MYKNVLCGDGAVGKTALLLRNTGNAYFILQRQISTIGAGFILKEITISDNSGMERTYKFQLWEIAGQQSFHSTRTLYYMGAHAVILVFDITRLSTFENTFQWIEEIVKGIGKKVFLLLLIANKIDLR